MIHNFNLSVTEESMHQITGIISRLTLMSGGGEHTITSSGPYNGLLYKYKTVPKYVIFSSHFFLTI
jgi:hypothetical protein